MTDKLQWIRVRLSPHISKVMHQYLPEQFWGIIDQGDCVSFHKNDYSPPPASVVKFKDKEWCVLCGLKYTLKGSWWELEPSQVKVLPDIKQRQEMWGGHTPCGTEKSPTLQERLKWLAARPNIVDPNRTTVALLEESLEQFDD
ncbi:unnamed protein product [marine sediment metagenome]|uniref:Uncharacterized protein n=1 Tax=marine sediment metagenome TaxID=412755 RepID=X0T4Z5_9ZZZZ